MQNVPEWKVLEPRFRLHSLSFVHQKDAHFCSVRVRTLTAEKEHLKHFVSNSRGEEGLKNQLSKEEKSSCNLSTLVIISFGGSFKCGAYRVSGGLRR